MRQMKYEIAILRIFACVLVIISHLACLRVFDFAYPQWDKANALYVARNACVPLFLCITGIVSLNKEKKYSYYIKNTLKFFIIFLIFLFAFSFYRDSTPFNAGITLGGFITIYRNGIYTQAHLWYLPLVAKLYLLIPILKKIVESEKISRIYLGLWFWTCSIYPLIITIINIFLVPEKPILSDVIKQTLAQTSFTELYAYSGFVILGFYLYNHFSKKLNLFVLIGTILAFIVAGSLINYYTYQAKALAFSNVWDYYSVFSVIPTACFVLIAKDYISKIKINEIAGKILGTISACCFGIYLIHPVLTERSLAYFVNRNLYISVPITAIIIFIICLVIVFIYRTVIQGIKLLINKIMSSAKK